MLAEHWYLKPCIHPCQIVGHVELSAGVNFKAVFVKGASCLGNGVGPSMHRRGLLENLKRNTAKLLVLLDSLHMQSLKL